MADGFFYRWRKRLFGANNPPVEDWQVGTPGTYLAATGTVSIGTVIVVSLYGAFGSADGWMVTGLAVAVSAAAFFAVGLIGYLFGVPRSRRVTLIPPADPDGEIGRRDTPPEMRDEGGPYYLDNDNLVDVSDWLTKIIIGIGLVELGELVGFVGNTGAAIGAEVPDLAGGKSIFVALIVFQGAAGFVFFYLWSRVYMPHLFTLANARARSHEERLAVEALENRLERLAKEQEVKVVEAGRTPPPD
jgi:hypothetical protein